MIISVGLIFMDNNIGVMIFVGAPVATRLLMDEVHGSKITLSEFMNLSAQITSLYI